MRPWSTAGGPKFELRKEVNASENKEDLPWCQKAAAGGIARKQGTREAGPGSLPLWGCRKKEKAGCCKARMRSWEGNGYGGHWSLCLFWTVAGEGMNRGCRGSRLRMKAAATWKSSERRTSWRSQEEKGMLGFSEGDWLRALQARHRRGTMRTEGERGRGCKPKEVVPEACVDPGVPWAATSTS